jgi:DNA gyrase subunit A
VKRPNRLFAEGRGPNCWPPLGVGATAKGAPLAARKPPSNPEQPPAPRPARANRRSTEERPPPEVEPVSLVELTRTRYLNYALSVITSRALPDVRDGLKPVQRRILYTMWQQGLTADVKHRKCAKVVGDVMGNFHPHGDAAIYDALVRMAQPFSLRVPLVDGSGNFGSVDGDPPAAYRYTECRLAAVASSYLDDIDADTVAFRPNYDGTRTEPVVLPARLPGILINGASGIAVGMATNIPPHNADEVCHAAIRLLDALAKDKELTVRELCRTIKGPDFPTGGRLVSSQEEIRSAYENGQGSLKLRGTWQVLEDGKKNRVVIDSIPYGVNKSSLVERIAEIVTSRAMPLLIDVRDISGQDIQVELELKPDADPHKVMAYLCKHTPLQINYAVNLTCLVPTENAEVGRPERLDLRSILWHFLQFRREVVQRRLGHELGQLKSRIHILEGFEIIFDALDEILRIVRRSDGKADAAQKIMARFKLDAEQTDAILELRIYRLAKLEILVIQNELAAKRREAARIEGLLGDATGAGIWGIVRSELEAQKGVGGPRRTEVKGVDEEPEFTAEDLILEEDALVVVTADGWIKRQKEIKDLAATRLREGDRVLACLAGSTRSVAVFFSNFGTAYSCRIADVPATTGYGEPIQKLFKLKDGESIVSAYSLDARAVGAIEEVGDKKPKNFGLAVSSDGYALAFGLDAFAEPSTRAGRRYAKPKEGARVLSVSVTQDKVRVMAVSRGARALCCSVSDVSYLSGPGRGVMLMKLDDDDSLLAARVLENDQDALVCRSSLGGEQRISRARYSDSERGGRGREVLKRGQLEEWIPTEVVLPAPLPRLEAEESR